jgi:hypothetical protein
MNTIFAKSLDSYIAADKRNLNAFGTLVTFAQEQVTAAPADVASNAAKLSAVLKNAIADNEAEYRKANPKLAEFPTNYRTAKSVILSAVKAGVSLVDADGKSKGKSALEKEVADGKADTKPEIEKFTSTMATAAAIFAKLDTLSDVQKAKELVRQLADMVVKAEAAMIAAAAETK